MEATKSDPECEAPTAMFKESTPFNERCAESLRMRRRHEDRVPVICEPLRADLPAITQKKFLFPKSFTVGQAVAVLRRRITDLTPETATFIFAGGAVPTPNETLGSIDDKYCDEDGFLYLTYGEESTFG